MILAAVALAVLAWGGQVVAAPLPAAGQTSRSADLDAAFELRVNAGGGAVTDANGKLWLADQAYTPGVTTWGYTGGAPYTRTVAISGTAAANWPLYQVYRGWRGLDRGAPVTGTYTFELPNGVYEVDLRFAEIYQLFSPPNWGQRYFDVAIEGVPYLCMVDLWSAVGTTPTPYDWTFPVTVTDGKLNLSFISHPGNAPGSPGLNQSFVSAIHITELPGYSRPPLAAYPRIGLGVNFAFGDITDYDVAGLHLGWYATWSLRPVPPRPNGIDFVQLIDTRGFNAATYNWGTLNTVIQSSPGSTFLIGNEQEATFQGNHTPAQYAQIYNTFYNYIKSRDPSAQIAVGGVVQASDARLRWLDMVLNAYTTTYGIPMPVDIWTIHDQTLGGSETNHWPVGLPTGTSAEYHPWVCGQANSFNDVNRFKNHVTAFRTWMKSQGYQNKPLWISEYGVLTGEHYGCTQQMIGAYLVETMEWMNNVTSASIGQPGDDYKLVQRWLWYSMNDQPFNPDTNQGFAGALCYHGCRQYPGALTAVGRAFRNWVNAITPPGPTRTPTATATPTATRTPLPAGNGVLQGSVQLQGRGAPPSALWTVPLTVGLFLPGDNLPAYQFATTTDTSGAFVVPAESTPGVWQASYDVKVKNPQMLQAAGNGLAFSDAAPAVRDFGLLRAGDANNDNRINSLDYALLSGAYLRSQGQAGFNPAADFNGSGTINSQDYALLSSNYLGTGTAGVASSASDAIAEPSGGNAQLDGSAVIRFNPATYNMIVNQSGQIEIRINHTAVVTQENLVAADIEFTFDPTYIQILDATAAAGWTRITYDVNNTTGRCQVSVGLPLGTAGVTGDRAVVIVSLRSKATTAGTPLVFASSTLVSQWNGLQADLTKSSGNVAITNPPTPTRTPTICAGCPTNTPTPTPPPLNIGVNAGGAAYTDSAGQLWQADKQYVTGSWGFIGGVGQTYSAANPIEGTIDDTLYQSEHYGMTQYAFDVSPGTYSVTLKFAEIYYSTAVGGRIFSVKAEGATVVSNLDILKEYGRYVAHDRSFFVTVSDYQLNLEFTASVGAAKVNAIRIAFVGGGEATPTPTATQTSAPGATATYTATATPTQTRTPTATATPRDPYEPNDTIEQATQMTAGRDYLGYIESGQDIDYYAFSVTDGNALIWASLTDLPADYDLFLHRPDRSLAAWSNYGGNTPEYILNEPVGGLTGVWYLRVVGYDRGYNLNTPYRLRLEVRTATATPTPTRTQTGTATPTRTPTATATRLPLDQFEPNNTFDQATLVTAGAVVFAYMDSAVDADYYKLSVQAGGRLALSLTQLPADYDLYLADPTRNVVAMSRYGGTANEYLFYTAPSAGTYYIYVVGFNHAYEPAVPYRLIIQVN
jgi:hypothetical protein